MKYSIQSLDSSLFDWLKWRHRSVHEIFDQPFRLKYITSEYGKMCFRRYAVGWCRGEELMCRPKEDHVGLMCFMNDEHFWFHLRNAEFDAIFGENESKA